ncbi:F-box protein CPR1-like [Papaver somniferum]|uniref:F-box protein CPR1-like n=1 Tax=Papaver somniferum TaxID=3469 RepID=UPI000E702046|nr:F-box protein CPR1-like [Papaver somniferum]
MSNMPEDVYSEILPWVPAKSAIICKSVCKTWYSLISNPKFVKLHLHRTIEKKNESKFVFLISGDNDHNYALVSSISYDLLYSSLLSMGDCDDAIVEMVLPFKDSAYPVRFLGTCHGLICMMYATIVGTAPFIVVWNPTTTECKILPNSKIGVVNHHRSIYSFGYDPKIDDYKLVTVVKLQGNKDGSVSMRGSKNGYVAEIYTLQSDSWRSIETIPYMFSSIPYDSLSGVLVNGARHWYGESRNLAQEFIVSFDFSKERFEQLHLPKEFSEIEHYVMTLGVLEDCLYLLASVIRPCIQHEVWMMQDYGVQESWTKHVVIRHQWVVQLIFTKVIWSFADGKILLSTEGHLVLYDPKQNTCTTKMVRNLAWILAEDNYVESLVSLHSDIIRGGIVENKLPL